jgi:hypothetical protein
MEVVCSSETSVVFQRTARRYIPEYITAHKYCSEDLKSYKINVTRTITRRNTQTSLSPIRLTNHFRVVTHSLLETRSLIQSLPQTLFENLAHLFNNQFYRLEIHSSTDTQSIDPCLPTDVPVPCSPTHLLAVAFLRLQLKALAIQVARLLYWFVKDSLPSLLTPTPIRVQIQLRGGTGAWVPRWNLQTKQNHKKNGSVTSCLSTRSASGTRPYETTPPPHSFARRQLKEKPVKPHYCHGAQAFFEKPKTARLRNVSPCMEPDTMLHKNMPFAQWHIYMPLYRQNLWTWTYSTICIVTFEVPTAGAVCSLIEVCRRFGECTAPNLLASLTPRPWRLWKYLPRKHR